MAQIPSSALSTKILLVDDERSYHEPVILVLGAEGYQVDVLDDSIQAMNVLQRVHYDLLLLDINMPKIGGMEILQFAKEHYPAMEVIMFTGVHDIKTAVECMKMGAFHYITKPFTPEELVSTTARAIERRHLVLQNTLMHSRLQRVTGDYSIIGTGPVITKLLQTAKQVAPSESSILLQGASGTGKELLAHFIHKNSNRSCEQFVPINCASIPDTLFESELFGHEKGAFTDAKVQKIGLVEIANKGTLFLDEIGDISPIVQPKLLRFIQTGEYRRVGSTIPLTSNVRIIAATNKNILNEVKEGRFREDLLYRLNVITLSLLNLKEHTEDIPLLIEYFLKNRYQTPNHKSISEDALERLMNYHWPGNIRELENVIERAVLLSTGKVIQSKDLLLPGENHALPAAVPNLDNPIGTDITLDGLEKIHIEAVLKKTMWKKAEAAKILDISLKTLYTKIASYQLRQD
ncbi:MAG: sigma-54-dependent transcriptional regulator [Bacteroidota bacterium]